MNMDHRVAMNEGADAQSGEGKQGEHQVLRHVDEFAFASSAQWHPQHIDTVADFSETLSRSVAQADQIDLHATDDQSLGFARRARVAWIVGIQNDGGSLSRELVVRK